VPTADTRPGDASRSAPGAVVGSRPLNRDGRLALGIAGILFVLAAWPLLLVDLPPLQDLPNHLAAVTVIEHPAAYPEFAFNGLLKTNSPRRASR